MRRILSTVLLLVLGLALPVRAQIAILPTPGSGSSGGGGCTVADPTALVGLTAVPGAATTCLRSDAAPALSQAISPTWTQPHTFGAATRLNGFVSFGGTTNSFPGMKNNGADLWIRKADDSGYAAVYASEFEGLNAASVPKVSIVPINAQVAVSSDGSFIWASGLNSAGAKDTQIRRRAAATLQLGDVDGVPIAQSMTVQGALGTDINGAANFTLQPSLGTGTGSAGYLEVKTGAVSTTSGTTVQTPVTRHTTGVSKVLTNNTAFTLVSAVLASGSAHGSMFWYAVEVKDATDTQVETGFVECRATNKAASIGNNVCRKNNGDADANHQSVTAGTLVVTFAISAANPALISVNANSSLTPSTGYPRIVYNALNGTHQSFNIQ